MNKYEVQQRVLEYGEPLLLELFTWDEKNKILLTDLNI